MRRLIFLATSLLFLAALSSASDGPKVGDRAPDFTLPMATKDTLVPSGIRLSDIIGKNILILAFYPADWSGGCTKEMCSLRDSFQELSGLGAAVYGISGDYIYSHNEWAKYHNLQFPLLSDHDHAVARMYNSFNAESGFNRRTVYVVGRDGRIAYEDLAYKPGVTESLESLRAAIKKLQ